VYHVLHMFLPYGIMLLNRTIHVSIMRNGVWGSIALYLVKGPGCKEIIILKNIFMHTHKHNNYKYVMFPNFFRGPQLSFVLYLAIGIFPAVYVFMQKKQILHCNEITTDDT